MDGLHGIDAIAVGVAVTTSTRAPIRAAASEASAPAWPAPTTTTSHTPSADVVHQSGDSSGRMVSSFAFMP